MARARHRPRYQRADLSLTIGDRTRVAAIAKLTPAGLLSIAALVSTVLLSAAVLVRTAVRDGVRDA